MESKLYTIEAISNLHAGSGEINYGIVDNLIQRDAITDLPVINSSSLKGALREYCKTSSISNEIEKLFGNKVRRLPHTPGSIKFFDANLLAMPVRSDKRPYLMATCPLVLNEFVKKCRIFNIAFPEAVFCNLQECEKELSVHPLVFSEEYAGAQIEDIIQKADYKLIEKMDDMRILIGDAPLILVSNDDFSMLCDNNHLPVIARNYLNDGKSENLFYEQVLPRLSRLYFVLIYTDKNDIEKFDNAIKKEIVQIGANASVGYGYCKIRSFNHPN